MPIVHDMISDRIEREIDRKHRALAHVLDEKARRMWAGAEARALGHGGVAAVARATGLAESTVRTGRAEVSQRGRKSNSTRTRQQGGGRKSIKQTDPTLMEALESLVEPTTRGDPMSPLKWTCKSVRNLAEAVNRQGHHVSFRTVAKMLNELGYSLQGVRKSTEGKQHPDRDVQFHHINERVKAFQRQGQPVISVDCKKKELVGNFANKGREYRPKGQPDKVRVHDFQDKDLGKAIPYGVYDITENEGWVSVGTDHETSQFAVESIRRWWRRMGQKVYPKATKLLIVGDGGGGNGSRVRLWKLELQRLADQLSLPISVSHFPPGTSKWNKIEHRMWSRVTENWRGRPLLSHEVIVNLIANTTTRTGLKIRARLDERKYPTKIEVTDEQMKQVKLKPDTFHGNDWNYTILPTKNKNR